MQSVLYPVLASIIRADASKYLDTSVFYPVLASIIRADASKYLDTSVFIQY